jgi:hypothetical protein
MFTRGMLGFTEIMVVVSFVYLLAAIALLNAFAWTARTSGLRCDRIELTTSEMNEQPRSFHLGDPDKRTLFVEKCFNA